MLKVAVIFIALLAAQETAVFKDDRLRLAFTYPKTWQIVKRQKEMTTFRVPIEGSTDTATLEVTRAVYRSEPEIWQLVQTHANKQLNREVVRQWEQEILGVPMLLTHIRFSEKAGMQSTITGLLYTRTPEKMLFRLTGPDGDFEKVKFEFDNVIQTLRALGQGELVAEDPSQPPVVVKPDEKIDLRPVKKTTFEPPVPKVTPVVGPVAVELTVSERKMQVRLPSGWTGESIEENAFLAKHPNLKGGQITVKVHSLLDSAPPRTALFGLANESLAMFERVGRREDVVDKLTRGGMTQNAVWRTGNASEGKLVTLDAVLVNDSHYALFSYRTTSDAERKLLEDLLSVASVVPAP